MYKNNNLLVKPRQQQFSYNKVEKLIIFYKIFKNLINKKQKKACLGRELVYGCVAITVAEFAKAAKCSTKTASRYLKQMPFYKFMGKDKGIKVLCEKLGCKVGDRRYFYGFVPTVKEKTTSLISYSNNYESKDTNLLNFDSKKVYIGVSDVPKEEVERCMHEVGANIAQAMAIKEEWHRFHFGRWVENPRDSLMGWFKRWKLFKRGRNKKFRQKVVDMMHYHPIKVRVRKKSTKPSSIVVQFAHKAAPNPCAGVIPASKEVGEEYFKLMYKELS